MRILMTGATGWVGRDLGTELVRRGHSLICLVRDSASARQSCPFPADWVDWPKTSTPLADHVFQGVDAVLHLMGEPIAGSRWTSEVKGRILTSRTDSTRFLAEKVRAHKIPVFVSASAIGYYGDRGEDELTESSPPGQGFVADVCKAWEEELFRAHDFARCVAIRIGIVLGRDGGALEKMLLPFLLGAGGPMGSGRQWMSWIHIGDLRRLLIDCLEKKEYSGAVNAVAPHPVKQMDFARTLGGVLKRPAFLPAPTFMLRALLGEMSQVVLASQKVFPKIAIDKGFRFDFPSLEAALRAILAPECEGDNEFSVKQFVPYPLDKVFPFYSDEHNLERITPPFLNFKVVGKSTPHIQSGTLLDYELSLHGVPFRWRTEILEWDPPYCFTDKQLRGPYAKWHHTHRFEALAGGTLISDRIRYRLPLGFAGTVVAGWKVRKDITEIFNYRRKVIAQESF